MQQKTSPLSDLVLIVTTHQLTLAVATDDESIRLLVPMPISLGITAFARVLASHLRAGHHARLLVSVAERTSREFIVLPIARAIDEIRAELGFPVIWIPDVFQLATAATPRPSSDEDDVED